MTCFEMALQPASLLLQGVVSPASTRDSGKVRKHAGQLASCQLVAISRGLEQISQGETRYRAAEVAAEVARQPAANWLALPPRCKRVCALTAHEKKEKEKRFTSYDTGTQLAAQRAAHNGNQHDLCCALNSRPAPTVCNSRSARSRLYTQLLCSRSAHESRRDLAGPSTKTKGFLATRTSRRRTPSSKARRAAPSRTFTADCLCPAAEVRLGRSAAAALR